MAFFSKANANVKVRTYIFFYGGKVNLFVRILFSMLRNDFKHVLTKSNVDSLTCEPSLTYRLLISVLFYPWVMLFNRKNNGGIWFA